MTTKIRVTNENPGAPYADWSIEVTGSCASENPRVLKPKESAEFYMWHDGRELKIRELPK